MERRLHMEAEIRARARVAVVVVAIAGVAVLSLAGVLAWAAMAVSSSPITEVEVEGSDPVASFRYISGGGPDATLFVQAATGGSLSDLFDMRMFEDVRPGMTPADFRNRYGASQFHGARAVLEVREEHDRDTLGTVTFRP